MDNFVTEDASYIDCAGNQNSVPLSLRDLRVESCTMSGRGLKCGSSFLDSARNDNSGCQFERSNSEIVIFFIVISASRDF